MLADMFILEVQAHVTENQGGADGSGCQNYQLACIGGDRLATACIGDSGRDPVVDFDIGDGRIVVDNGTTGHGFRNLRMRRAHQRIVFAGHTSIQSVATVDTILAI